jgi:hypothetical protein
VSGVQVQVFYLATPPVVSAVRFRDLTTFADAGSPAAVASSTYATTGPIFGLFSTIFTINTATPHGLAVNSLVTTTGFLPFFMNGTNFSILTVPSPTSFTIGIVSGINNGSGTGSGGFLSAANIPFTWSATLGSLVLASEGTLAETESISVTTRAANGAAPAVGVLLDEIAGTFEPLAISNTEPPQLAPSTSLLSYRYQLSQGTVPPICTHLQLQLSGGATNTKDEVLRITIRGALVPEQE